MVALGGLTVVLIAGGVLMLGLWAEQGWLTVLAMLFLGVTMVVVLALPAPPPQQRAPAPVRAPVPVKEFALPAAEMAAVAAFGLVLGGGLLLEWGWLTVLGMLMVGVALVVILARASRHEHAHG